MKPKSSFRKLSPAGTLSLIAASSMAFALASGQSQSIAATARGSMESLSSGSIGKSKVEADQYRIEMKASGSYRTNTEGAVEIAITPKADFHINEQFPVKFKATETQDGPVKYPKPVLKREDGTFEPTRGSMKVPFIASRAGTAKVSGVLSVSVCNPKQCVMDKVELDLDVDVK